MSYTKIAVAGATGNLGPSIIRGLVDAGFEVTVLSRSGKTEGLPSTIKSIAVDYTSQDSLVNALKGQDALISNLPNHQDQPALIDAAIAAGVKRFLPSEFGSNISGNEKAAALPVFQGKVATQEYIKKVSDRISYTLVVTGLFLDWSVKVGFSINLNGTTRVYDDPNAKHSLTTLPDIGTAVANILKKPEETKNRTVYIQSAAVSQNELLALAREVKPGFKGETEQVSSEQVLKDGYAALQKGGEAIGGAMISFIAVSVFGEGYGNNWDGKNDNELLGLKEKSAEELKAIVGQYA